MPSKQQQVQAAAANATNNSQQQMQHIASSPAQMLPQQQQQQQQPPQSTPTLNILLSKPSMVAPPPPPGSGQPALPQSQTYPDPSLAYLQPQPGGSGIAPVPAPPQIFQSPQQSPVPNGSGGAKGKKGSKQQPAPPPQPQQQPPPPVHQQEWSQHAPVSPATHGLAHAGYPDQGGIPPPHMYPGGQPHHPQQYWPRYPQGAMPPGHHQPSGPPPPPPPHHAMPPGNYYPVQPPPQMSYPAGYPMNNAVPSSAVNVPIVRMPNGPTPQEWQRMQQNGPMVKDSNMSPGAVSSTANDNDSMEDRSIRGSPAAWSQGGRTPISHQQPGTPGMVQGMPTVAIAPQQMQMPPAPIPQPPPPPVAKLGKDASVLDKLVGLPSAHIPAQMIPVRRDFFERLIEFCEQQGDPLTAPPTVSKQTIDLHRLYVKVKHSGGFEQVTREKTWKNLCRDANPDMSESSAAGYQLRKHYTKFLLRLECMETGRNADELIAFAEKLKKKKKTEKPETSFSSPGGPGPSAAPPGAYPGGPNVGPPPQSGDPNAAYYYGHAGAMEQHHRGSGWPAGYPPGSQPPPGQPQHPGYPAGPPPPGQQPHPGMVRMGGPPLPPHGATPMRAPHPQMMQPNDQMTYEDQQRAAAAHHQQQQYYMQQHQQQQQQQQQFASQAQNSNSLQVDTSGASNSRAPSAGPPGGSATPDSNSRLSAEDAKEHHRPSSSQQQHMPLPPNAAATPPAGMPPGGSYYSQGPPPGPQMYHRPPHPGGGGGQPYQGGYPPNQPAAPSGGYAPGPGGGYGPEGGYALPPQQPPQQYHPAPPPTQQQMWQQQRPSPSPAAAYGMTPGPAAGPMQAGGPRMHHDPNNAYARRPPGPQPYYGQPGPQPTQPLQSTPTSSQPGRIRVQYTAPLSTSATPQPGPGAPGYMLQPHAGPGRGYGTVPYGPSASASPSQHTGSQLYAHGLPSLHQPGTVESTTISHRRKRKIMARELHRADAMRITMALKSGLESEIIWAVNCLNVLLYDDASVGLFNLNNLPGLLEMLLEHLRSCLAILFPDDFEPCGDKSAELAVVDDSDFWKANEKEKTLMKPFIIPDMPSGSKPINNFNQSSRLGWPVQIDVKQEPWKLNRQRPAGFVVGDHSGLNSKEIRSRKAIGRGNGAANLFGRALNTRVEMQKILTGCRKKTVKREVTVVPEDNEEDEKSEEEYPFFYRQPKRQEKFLLHGSSIMTSELRTVKPTALSDRADWKVHLIRRTLAISNIIRGFSFLPGNETSLARTPALLMIYGKFLRLYSREAPIRRSKNATITDLKTKLLDEEPRKNGMIFSDVLPKHSLETAPVTGATSADLKLESDDEDQLMLYETAQQLREDAFTIICHISPMFDLYEMEGCMVYSLLDGLLHWSVSRCAEAKDPLQPGIISPRNYSLEALCKMSVIERNVDMLLATGPWPRLEELVRVLGRLLSLGEETQVREFAIVIMSAICAASEAICVVAAEESPVVQHLVAFLEMGDSNMHQVVQAHGINALRDNPEMMGTSVGMLRRAAATLQQLCRVPSCRKQLVKHQQRLLQFTMSSLMDSRVAVTVAATLFEVQNAQREEMELANARIKAESEADEPVEAVQPEQSEIRPADTETVIKLDEEEMPPVRKRSRTEENEEINGKEEEHSRESPAPEKTNNDKPVKLEQEQFNGDDVVESMEKPTMNGGGQLSPVMDRGSPKDFVPAKLLETKDESSTTVVA